jgi:hypothetical protein
LGARPIYLAMAGLLTSGPLVGLWLVKAEGARRLSG